MKKRFAMRLLLLLLPLLILSCSPGKPTDSRADQTAAVATDEIVFLTFKIEKDSLSHQNKITLLHQTKAAGKLKAFAENAGTPQFLTVELFQGEQLSKSFTIAHPLYKHLEYLDANQHFAVKEAQVDQEEFFFRIQTKGNGYRVRISETLNHQPKTELLTLTL
ncbi:hypothetical protein [Flavobacterium sp.]|uniref:hypothetical protein n=1 Tax=Flavobacterium sp. TaxID=239 RepID=UPI0039E688A4